MGADVLQNLSMTRTVECMKGIAWEFPNGLVPYGDANNFLFSRQISVLPNFPALDLIHSTTITTLFLDMRNVRRLMSILS